MKNKELQVGDFVDIIDDDFSGKICKIQGDHIVIETSDGFELTYHRTEVIPKATTNEIEKNSHRAAIQQILSEEQAADAKRKKNPFKSKKEAIIVKIDLHIEKLVKNPKQYSNFEKLNIQVEQARSQIEFAIENNIKHLVLIHGMGDGVLKAEIETILGRYSGIYYQKADYATYGLGATEVFLNQPMPI